MAESPLDRAAEAAAEALFQTTECHGQGEYPLPRWRAETLARLAVEAAAPHLEAYHARLWSLRAERAEENLERALEVNRRLQQDLEQAEAEAERLREWVRSHDEHRAKYLHERALADRLAKSLSYPGDEQMRRAALAAWEEARRG